MTSLRRAAVLVTAVLALSACGGEAYDEAAHKAELEATAGHPAKDWATVQRLARDICAESEPVFALTVATFMGQGDVAQLRVNVRHLCPERTAEIDAAGG